MSDLNKYMAQIRQAFPGAPANDLYAIGKQTLDKVGAFLTERNMVKNGDYDQIQVANESLAFDDAMTTSGIEELHTLVKSCGVADAYIVPCCESIINIMDRCLKHSTTSAWNAQSKKADNVSNASAASRSLSEIYASDTVGVLSNGFAPSAEAFGVNIDLACPDLKIAVSIAIMNYHTRLLHRILPTKAINQPQIQFTKEFLEVYDLKDVDGQRQRLIDLYRNPQFAANELQKIIPLTANEESTDPADFKFLVKDGVLKFGVKANILKLSMKDAPGFSKLNRTDLIAEAVKMESVIISLAAGGQTEEFVINVPMAVARLTRMINAADSAMRNADIKFRVKLRKDTPKADGTPSAILASLGDAEAIVVSLNIKPTISLKFGEVDCLGAVSIAARHDTDNEQLSDNAKQIAAGAVELVGYSIDARFSEENLRKTCIAVWTHRQPFAYDIPIGRNYVFDYAIGQDNAEENATNLTKIIGIGQDDIALRTICIRTLEDVYDRIAAISNNPEDKDEYVGKYYVAGDKVNPSVFIGKLDYSDLNIIRDADRAGDIKQKAITYLTAATTKVLYDSYFMQQIGGAGVTFKCITSLPIIGNVIGQPHIHDHMNKEDQRDIGDGVEYVLVLPNGVRIEFVTSTFDYMENKMVMWPVIKNNPESELNYAINLDYGTMVAHYTPSGEEAHHRMFGNIRELPIVTNPVGLIIDVAGMDIVNGIAENAVLRPSFHVDSAVNGNIEVSGQLSEAGEGTNP